ncbi:MAG: carbohydrate-binding domain-containing protein [Oscillibacter sp.]|nr:carbohydrate-binding domain-containing protein [Oscillibacter sp.]
MKRRTMGYAALALSASLALTACGGSAAPAAEGTAESKNTETIGSAVENTEESAAVESPTVESGETASSAAQTETTDTTLFNDTFSSRDLSGTWDAAEAVSILLNSASISCDNPSVSVSGSAATITAAGTYRVAGTLDNGFLIVDAGTDDKVQIVLDSASIHSETFAALYVRQADKVFLTLADGTVNTLSSGGGFEAIDENNVDGTIFSKDDLTLNGSGTLAVSSPAKHAIVSKDDLIVTGGTYDITAASHALSAQDGIGIAGGSLTINAGKDGIHTSNDGDGTKGTVYVAGGTIALSAADDGVTASGLVQVDGGTMDITAAEGMEGNYIRINDGTITIQASDDGINAAQTYTGAPTPCVEFNGGDITVTVGQGDTDCVDSNGDLIITGGTIRVTGNSGFDFDGSVTFIGGTVYVNGEQVTTITSQMMGGRGGGFGGMMGGNAGPRGNHGHWENQVTTDKNVN